MLSESAGRDKYTAGGVLINGHIAHGGSQTNNTPGPGHYHINPGPPETIFRSGGSFSPQNTNGSVNTRGGMQSTSSRTEFCFTAKLMITAILDQDITTTPIITISSRNPLTPESPPRALRVVHAADHRRARWAGITETLLLLLLSIRGMDTLPDMSTAVN